MTHELIRSDCQEIAQSAKSQLDALRGETLLITGGTGFMGSWLAELIAYFNDNFDYQMKVILLSRSPHKFGKLAPHLANRNDFTLVEKDVRSFLEIPPQVTYIIHAAANPDSRQHVLDPLKVMDVIVKGTDSLLEAANQLPKLNKILNISSGLIYGTTPLQISSIPESYYGGLDCNSVTSIYAEAKRFAESRVSAYRALYKLPIVTARPFSFIGPYQLLDKPWAINNFIRDSLHGDTIRILGDGETVRSYMYPSDMAYWLLRILTAGVPGLTYNVGSPCGITLKNLAEKIASNFASRPRIIVQNLREDSATQSKFVPDVSLVEKSLGLKLQVDLDQSIQRTLAWFRQQPKT